MATSFASRIHQQPAPLGTILSSSALDVADLIAGCGFDWLMLDTEHGSLTSTDVQRVLSVVQPRTFALVRIPDDQEAGIKKALDAGADGIIVPQVNSAQSAANIVSAAKYPPMGARSVGIGRAHEYGEHFADYIQAANSNTAVIIQVEHRDAVDNIEEIAAVEGVDGIFIGPYDLSGSLGCIGEVGHPDVQKAITRVREACSDAGMPVGIFGLTATAAKVAIDSGYDFVVAGIDLPLLGSAARQLLRDARGEL